MRSLVSALAAVMAVGVGVGTASAQDAPPVAAPKAITVSLTPRVWYAFDSNTLFNSSTNTQITQRSANYPFYGLSAEVSTSRVPRWSLLLNGYYGTGSTIGRTLQFNQVGLAGAVQSGAEDVDFTRYDLEFLARYLATPQIGVTVGFRSIHFDEKVRFNLTETFPNTLLPPVTGIRNTTSRKQYYLAEAGTSFTTPISDDGRHSLFAGATLGLGNATTDFGGNQGKLSVFITSLDVNVGYQFRLTDSISLNARYRAIMLAGETGQFPGQILVVHGPEVGVTFRF